MPFVDASFPADQTSLLDSDNNNGGLSRDEVEYFRRLKWRRAPEFFKASSLWVGDQIQVDSIKQGQLRNSYFTTAINLLGK